MSRVIKALEGKDLIKNANDPKDGRANALKPTGKGKKTYASVMDEVMRSNERVLAPLSLEEVQAFDVMLEKLTQHTRALLDARMAQEM